MYNETDSFYYCETYDLSNSVQRQYSKDYHKDSELWRRTDERFFWNLHMLQELIDVQVSPGYIYSHICLLISILCFLITLYCYHLYTHTCHIKNACF